MYPLGLHVTGLNEVLYAPNDLMPHVATCLALALGVSRELVKYLY